MKISAVLSGAATAIAALAMPHSAQASFCRCTGGWPGVIYNYDGYQPPPAYYRAYYGAYRPIRAKHRHWAHRRSYRARYVVHCPCG